MGGARLLEDALQERQRRIDTQRRGALQGAPAAFILVCGFDPGGDPYGRVFEVVVPTSPEPDERNPGNTFGLAWGGQREIVDRLLTGFDGRALSIAQSTLHLDDAQTAELDRSLRKELSTPIPFQFLPLQACVDLCVFLVRATADLQTWTVDVRGVGGPIDVATVTRTEGSRLSSGSGSPLPASSTTLAEGAMP